MPRPSLSFRTRADHRVKERSRRKRAENRQTGPKGNAVSGPVTASIAGLAVRLGALAGRRPGEGAGEWEEWEEWEGRESGKSGGEKMRKNGMALMSGTRDRLASAVFLSCPPSFFPALFPSQKARREGKKRGWIHKPSKNNNVPIISAAGKMRCSYIANVANLGARPVTQFAKDNSAFPISMPRIGNRCRTSR